MKQIIITFIISILALYPADNNGVEFNKEEISEEVTNNNSEFAIDIFRELNKEDSNKNIFISPFSISTALTMTYNGAVGETKKEMEEALRYLNININEVNQTYKNLIPYLNQVDSQ
jgi:serpin B